MDRSRSARISWTYGDGLRCLLHLENAQEIVPLVLIIILNTYLDERLYTFTSSSAMAEEQFRVPSIVLPWRLDAIYVAVKTQ